LDVPYFKDIIPSAENISIFIYDIIKNHIKNDLELEVVLYETPRNFVTYNGN
jgi:6-pyruvoyltetrahydropterin/6-carboxytetrahydropterin synthase